MKSMRELYPLRGLYQKSIIAVSSLGLAAIVSGCSTTIYAQKEGVAYDCNTSNTYPSWHPCYDVVQDYRASQRARSYSSGTGSTSSTSSGLSVRDHDGVGAKDSASGRSGHKECHPK